MSIRDTIAGYIEEIARKPITDHSSNLFEYGLLTSLDVLSIVAFLEETFGLEIAGDDIDMATFGSIDGLVAMVSRKQKRVA